MPLLTDASWAPKDVKKHYIVKESVVRPEWIENKYLTLSPNFSALYCHEEGCPFGGGFMETKKLGTYTVDREKGVVTVKLTKSEFRTNDVTMKNEDKVISEEQEYTLKALGL